MSHGERDQSPATIPLPPLPETGPAPDGVIGFDDPVPEGSYAPERRPRADLSDSKIASRVGDLEADQAEKAARDLHVFIGRFRSTSPSGYFEIRRTGPADLPPSERGKVGKIRMSDLKGKSLLDVVEEQFGGGEYDFVAKDAGHNVVPGGQFTDEIVGDPRVRSLEGRAWLDRKLGGRGDDGTRQALERLTETLERPPAQPSGGGGDSIMLMMQFMERTAAKDREDRDRREKTEREDRERKEKAEQKDKEEREARALKREKEEREERERRDKREAEDRAEERRLREARDARDSEERKQAFEMRMKQIEANAGGGLGMDGLKKVKEMMLELAMDTVTGPGEEAPESWSQVAKNVISKDGGALLGKFLDTVAQTRGLQPSPPLRAPATPQALPGPEGEGDPDADIEEGVPQVANPAEAMGEMGKIAAQKALGRATAFVRLIGSEIMATGSPEAIWDAPQDENGTTLADLWDTLAEPLRAALRKGWLAFAATCPGPMQHDVQAITGLLAKHPSAVSWMKRFIAAIPQDDEGEEEPVEETAPEPEAENPPVVPAPEPPQPHHSTEPPPNAPMPHQQRRAPVRTTRVPKRAQQPPQAPPAAPGQVTMREPPTAAGGDGGMV